MADEPLAITPDGKLIPVSEFSEADKWWCDCEDMDVPHVHTPWGPPRTRAVDLLTGRDFVKRDGDD